MSFKSPFIRPIRVNGGTFYTFTSSNKILPKIFNSDHKKFVFSKFVLLNLPEIKTIISNNNFIGLNNIPGAFYQIDGSKTWNDYLAESFQNYCLNLENVILNNPNYVESDLTVSERVFFKWLKEIGAIRFRVANSNETLLSNNTFVEEDESNNYQRVVQYVGNVDLVNNVVLNSNSFSEVYINIPSEHGRFPYVLFKTISDNNYHPNMVLTSPNNYILGRDITDTHPAGLDFRAHFDSYLGIFQTPSPSGPNAIFYSFDTTTSTWIPSTNSGFQWWFSNPIPFTYYTEPYTFTDVTNQKLKIDNGTFSKEFIRSKLDGISIDFDINSYKIIKNNFKNFSDFSQSGITSNFEFNVVLVYYDIIDEISNSTTTNLFGVLFLDNVVNVSGGGGKITPFEKFKANSITGDNGIAYSFKLNFKFDTNNETILFDSFVNEYNTFSMNLFTDAMDRLLQNNVNLENILIIVNDIKERLESLENSSNQTVINDLYNKISSLETYISNNINVFESLDELKSLIQRNYEEILNIYRNQTSIEVAYNLDLLKSGSGINIIKKDNNSNFIENIVQGYTIKKNYSDNFKSILFNFVSNPNFYSYEFVLDEFTNFLKITDGSFLNPFILDRDVYIYIKDDATDWKKGQVFKLFFKYGLNLNNMNGVFNVIVFTDFKNKLNSVNNYSKEVVKLTFNDFIEHNYKPVVEIVCLDPDNLIFDVNIY